MARSVIFRSTAQPYHKYVGKDGEVKKASPTVDSLLKVRVRKQEKKKLKRVVIRHKREL